jgi:ABC-type polysaccharide/polyol phosphate export permease
MNNKTMFFQLLKTRLLIARPFFIDKIINLSIWAFCSLFISGYVMQQFGLSAGFGIFQLAGVIGTAGLFEIYPSVVAMVLDFSSEQTILYYLTLPTTPWIVIASTVAGFALQGIALCLWMIPLGKLIFFNQLNLANIAWLKLIISIIVANLFFSSLIPAVAAATKHIGRIGNAWSRFIFPMWFLGGFQFSWNSIYGISKPLAYCLLLNPVTYVMESMRSSILGQEGFLRWNFCMTALIFCFICSSFYSYYRMKKLLDFV